MIGMTRLDFSLPEDLSEWATARAAETHLSGAGEYVAELLRRDREDAGKLARLKAAIDEGLASPIVQTTIEDIIARGKARHGIA